MIPAPISSGRTLHPWFHMINPNHAAFDPFWEGDYMYGCIQNLQDTIALLEAVHEELEMLSFIQAKGLIKQYLNRTGPPSLLQNGCNSSHSFASAASDGSEISRNYEILLHKFLGLIERKGVDLDTQVGLSLESANSLFLNLETQLVRFSAITEETSSWEQRSAAIKLANKIQKSKRNRRWRKNKRKHVAEMRLKERARYDEADQAADEWRAREIAKDIARRKMENMKAIAKVKANEERKKLESEALLQLQLELVLIVEKLQELRSIRIQKLQKQGHFLPEEDDKFLERVRVAVEEEERQAAAAADTCAAKDAIAIAEESRQAVLTGGSDVNKHLDMDSYKTGERASSGQFTNKECGKSLSDRTPSNGSEQRLEGKTFGGGYDSVTNLPIEFYHYYHGSNTDIGTLIEVRRTWDAYIRPGGSRIPGHWVEPPLPADDIWASYLVDTDNVKQ
ncbi:U11/U12 small nuclear ribonucleoprotein 59 kDa protein isoform X1 [Amborella trichopoda]|uniref:U11/U12 small nuclear ribonucleoprotein 59 kDa protein isoform X1 n=1 Tax=Amborella trichopoda TaxID=13333 RepID=UPI0009BCDECA|nr:U11/U12 small nuclear ribonucleoprotein 59 kDa protein isoform X1 [Amborella trichopoda]XP_020526992.1 U11/U12 small nuclear ribonucleoprotein 59 kDa protein isoform X1 [Amborella trichopoda]|eukprot:XP_020526991.1 U11/U12 small nuclear ribonucleoprotein 59 kDa protein isoform X1 [Amborella trichopoda]